MKIQLLAVLSLVIAGCSKSGAEGASPELAPPQAAAAPPATAPAAVPSLVPGTRVVWPAESPGSWIGIADRAGMLRIVAGTARGAVRDVDGASFEDEYIEVDDSFRITPVGENLIVARSMAKLSEAYREVFLLASNHGTARVVQRWDGLEGERAPFEPPPAVDRISALGPDDATALTADDTFRWSRGASAVNVAAAHRAEKVRLVTLDPAGRAQDVRGGAFALEYDPDSVTVGYAVVGDRLVARMSTAANVEQNCEALLVDQAGGMNAVPRVVERWRGDCAARAPFEGPE